MAMRNYKVLAGLPTYGELPEQFSETGMGTHSEGFVVEFYPKSSSAWVGNFQRGVSGFNEVLEHPDGASVIVIAGGEGYVINPENRKLLETFGGMIECAIPVPGKGIIIFGNSLDFEAHGCSGRVWRSRRLSWDGIRNLSLDGEQLYGEAWSFEDLWLPFTLDINTGECQGGAYIE